MSVHKKGWLVVLVLLTVSTSLVKQNATQFQVSLLTVPEHAPFDGAVYPVQQIPDWLHVTADERAMNFDNFPAEKLLNAPSYNPSRLPLDMNTLKWGDPYDDHTRLMKITYPVPYAGTYKLDGIEGAGSHPAVDIKTLEGTPIHAVMNGVVERVSYSSGGFGNAVVIRHDRVPSPENPEATITLFSGYAHMSTIQVTEGQVVRRNDVIGTVGHTGTATTDHLHFQIDRAEAPWHPYWPFTTAEANSAGGFFQAISAGVGRDNVYKYTINPMNYVQENLNVTPVEREAVSDEANATDESSGKNSATDSLSAENDTSNVNSSENSSTSNSTLPTPTPQTFSTLEFNAPEVIEVGENRTLTISMVDEQGEPLRVTEFNTPMKVTVSDPEVVEVFPTEIPQERFTTGSATINVHGLGVGTASVTFTFMDKIFTLGEVTVMERIKPLTHFAIETDGNFYMGSQESVVIVALNDENQRVARLDLADPIRLTVVQGQGYFRPEILTSADFKDGMATVQFTPLSLDSLLFRAESGVFSGSSALLNAELFADVTVGHEYAQAIGYLKKSGAISGYEDNTFQPDRAVSRVEALKLILAGLGKPVPESATALSFRDTDSRAWYAPFVSTAQLSGIVQGYPDGLFRPSNEVNRVEFIKMLLMAMEVDVDPVVIGNPYDDVHYLEWYAPYAQFVKETAIAPWLDSELNPGMPMTRGDVAEMIYRILAIQANGAERYSRTLVLE